MLDFKYAALIALLLSGIPLAIVARTVYFALISKKRFVATEGFIETHEQPKNEAGDPIQLRLTYRYRVNDRQYAGRRYYFGSLNESDPELLARYPAGTLQPVFYDPKSPGRSTLQTGFHARLWFWMATALVAFLLLWIFLVALLVAGWNLTQDTIDGLL